jgi:hypothetical protein
VAACDTDDGRQMRQPTAAQRSALEATTTSTTTTTTTLAPITLAPTTSPGTTSEALGTPLGSTGDAAATAGGGSDAPPASAGAATALVDLVAPWAPGGAIDPSFTCDGAAGAPPITWTDPAEPAVELALVAIDEDSADEFVHWTVIGLPPAAGLVGGADPLAAGTEGTNSSGAAGWFAPCPPAGETHDYRFTLHLLDQQVEMPADTPAADLVTAIRAATFAEVSVTGTYARPATSSTGTAPQ